jgi:pyruvate dehydrogenase E1 component beta subunit
MLVEAEKAAAALEQDGIKAEVIDLLTVNPFDMETIYESVKKTNRCVIIHEAKKLMGCGAEIAASLQENMFDWLDAPVARVAAPFTHIAFHPALEKHYLPDAENLIAKVKELVG